MLSELIRVLSGSVLVSLPVLGVFSCKSMPCVCMRIVSFPGPVPGSSLSRPIPLQPINKVAEKMVAIKNFMA